MELSAETRDAYLKDEYLFLQGQYEDFDRRSLTIKGWFAGGGAAAIALSFTASTPHSYAIPIIVALVAAVFWYLEAYWKLFQYALTDRIRIIEAHFRDDPDILVKAPEPFQIYQWWFRSYSKDEPIYPYERQYRPATHAQRLPRIAFQRFVCLPYLVFIALSAASLVVLLFSRPNAVCWNGFL